MHNFVIGNMKTSSCWFGWCGMTKRIAHIATTAMRFELTRAKPSRFLVYRLNHSATLSNRRLACLDRGFHTTPSDLQTDALPTDLSRHFCSTTHTFINKYTSQHETETRRIRNAIDDILFDHANGS